MRHKRRGSLSLSVNAIVVFILAFAMLGVGLFFVNKVRGSIDIDPNSFLPSDQLKNPPSSDDPLTIDNEIKMKAKEQKKVLVGFYAKETTYDKGIRFSILECTNAENGAKYARSFDANQKLVEAITCTPGAGGIGCPVAPAVPTLPSILPDVSATIPQGEPKGIPQILSGQNALSVGSYVCTLVAVLPASYQADAGKFVASKSFYLTIQP